MRLIESASCNGILSEAMMNSRVELELDYVNERLRAERIGAARHRLVSSCERPHSMMRLVARPIARAIVALGTSLLRYAYADSASPGALSSIWPAGKLH